VLCAAFPANPSRDLAETLWLAESYARLAALCLQDREALHGLIADRRLDGLTGCLTQVAFVHELRREVARTWRHNLRVSCASIDLDGFKRINDRHGHLRGSRVLANLAKILRTEIRSEDTIGRYGGDEFLLLLPNTGEAAALDLVERLRATVTTAMLHLHQDPLEFSIGVAQSQPGMPWETLLACADEALLAAKAHGGGAIIAASTLADARALSGSAAQVPVDHRAGAPEREISLRDVLEAIHQFDPFGGASVELTAWELNVGCEFVTDRYSELLREGLIVRAEAEPGTGEALWRLSDDARSAIESPAARSERPRRR
jgi:diguanylate cyclase (GGDEF)-like protein